MLTHGHGPHQGRFRLCSSCITTSRSSARSHMALICREMSSEYRITPVFVGSTRARAPRGVFECEYFAVIFHSGRVGHRGVIPARGTILHTGDLKFDDAADGRPTDLPGMWHLPAWTCCCATRRTPRSPVSGPSEKRSGPTLHRLVGGADGQVMVACFASNVDRVSGSSMPQWHWAGECRSSTRR